METLGLPRGNKSAFGRAASLQWGPGQLQCLAFPPRGKGLGLEGILLLPKGTVSEQLLESGWGYSSPTS